MILLALDTALGAASVCVWDCGSERALAVASVALARGHETILIPLVQQALAEAAVEPDRLDRIAATVGPGSFTGLRIGVAAARGFGLALDRPVVGVSTLAAFAAAELPLDRPRRIIASVDARRGRVFAQEFAADGRPAGVPRLIAASQLAQEAGWAPVRLVGPGSCLLAEEMKRLGRTPECGSSGPLDIRSVARLGAWADAASAPAAPLYLEAPATTIEKGSGV
jgi:tRNA threonylcarbamoyladenosine biosynthesis protein TsaB